VVVYFLNELESDKRKIRLELNVMTAVDDKKKPIAVAVVTNEQKIYLKGRYLIYE
jgi:hypothetical protein